MLRKITTKITLISLLLLSSSCVTNFLWGARDYKEEISQFYIGSDGRYVVFMGPEYHYIFTDNSGILREVLSLKQKGALGVGSDILFELDDNNNLEGDIILEGAIDLMSREDAIRLQLLGFIPNKKNDIEIKIHLKGRRYSARFLSQKPAAQEFDKNRYFVTVKYRKQTGIAAGVGKAAITPVAVTLDAALLIGKVVIYPFTLPYKSMGIE
jgi:hypothetical protein